MRYELREIAELAECRPDYVLNYFSDVSEAFLEMLCIKANHPDAKLYVWCTAKNCVVSAYSVTVV
jgi:hypothetical protein